MLLPANDDKTFQNIFELGEPFVGLKSNWNHAAFVESLENSYVQVHVCFFVHTKYLSFQVKLFLFDICRYTA